jgi:hypothetical protein
LLFEHVHLYYCKIEKKIGMWFVKAMTDIFKGAKRESCKRLVIFFKIKVMKTIKFRLFATIITLAAVTTTIPLNAQRRSTGNSGSTENSERSTDERRNSVKEKSSSTNNAYERKATERTVKNQVERNRNATVERYEPKARNDNNSVQSRQAAQTTYNVENRNLNGRTVRETQISAKPTYQGRSDSGRETNERQIKSEANRNERTVGSAIHSSRESYNSERENRSERVSGVSSRERYNLNNNDERYRVNSNYRGSNNNWTPELRSSNKHNNGNLKSGYNYYWENNWENYRWNHYSWQNYYSYYDRYSYCNHKYYYHHPYYGHVIRRFAVQPTFFIHNHNRYYCYDGHFFRYRPGIGYILADIPYGMTFEYLPNDYERVYINGYLYFRVNNLFFEYTHAGYQLIHYPERYYAYDDDYYNPGFSFEVRIN